MKATMIPVLIALGIVITIIVIIKYRELKKSEPEEITSVKDINFSDRKFKTKAKI